jgi:hypothetical protein
MSALANLKKTMDKPYEVIKAASMMLELIGRGIDPSEIEKGSHVAKSTLNSRSREAMNL